MKFRSHPCTSANPLVRITAPLHYFLVPDWIGMPRLSRGVIYIAAALALCGTLPAAAAQTSPGHSPPPAQRPTAVTFNVVDENGVAISGAQLTIQEAGQPPVHLITDYAGRALWTPKIQGTYSLVVERPNFYRTSEPALDTSADSVTITLTHEQWLQQQVNVTASTQGIDPQQVSDKAEMNTEEVVNVPYPTNIDIRGLLPFIPGVVADATGQVHVAGGETYMTLDTLDGFDIRNPIFGTLDLRVPTDAVRSLDTETTRYPVQYGRSTGGVIAYTTGMGDNKFRYNATDFIPSFRSQNGIRFDTFEPRITISGPIVSSRAWYFNSFETEYNDIYIPGLPDNADTDHVIRGSNLLKFQSNVGKTNSLTTALLFNDYHSPYEGLSILAPQESTDDHDIIAWLPYASDQQSFKNGIVLDAGFGDMRYREGWEPHGATPYVLNPEQATGSNFESQTTLSQRLEAYANAYLPRKQWLGSHQVTAGIDADHIGYNFDEELAPVSYDDEARTLVRLSTFPSFTPAKRHNVEIGAWAEDRWSPRDGLLIEPGLRFDWDEIIRRPLFSPRIAMNFSPPGQENTTKFTAGIGEYYEHTQLEFLTRALAGVRYDTYYAPDGTTPLGPPAETLFTVNQGSLREAHALNWSVGVEHELPFQIYAGANYMQKRITDEFVYANQDGTGAQPGDYLLTNNRQDHYHSIEVQARRSFTGDYTLFAAYTRSSATTNDALDYVPTIPILGVQQSGPLSWDSPNRILSWGWLPAWAPWLPSVHKNWDFVYTLTWSTGYPFDSFNDLEDLAGVTGSHRFPDFLSFDPGLEWRFHFHGKYFGLRGMVDNITNAADPGTVNPNVSSPQYLTFSNPLGRGFTTRIRLIQSSK